MIKKIILTILALAIYAANPAASAEREKEIPTWVKKRLNSGQYRMLKELSRHYESIDYTMFKRRDLDTTGFYLRLYKAVEDANVEPRAKSCSFILTRVITPYTQDLFQCTRKKCIVYSSIEGFDAHVELEFCYYIDKAGYPIVLYWEADAKSFSGIPVRYEESKAEALYNNRFDYREGRNIFEGYIVGNIYFTDAYGNEHKEPVSENFEIKFQ